jgi:hypothetical protein
MKNNVELEEGNKMEKIEMHSGRSRGWKNALKDREYQPAGGLLGRFDPALIIISANVGRCIGCKG